MEPLLASPLPKPSNKSPLGGSIEVEDSREASSTLEKGTKLPSLNENLEGAPNEYALLQRRIFLLTLVISVLAVLLTAIFCGIDVSLSFLVGALSGLFYLRLLARSIDNLGKTTSGVSKVQLLVPVVLFLVVSKLPQLQLLPSLLGFFLYKPSLIMQFLLET